jgi:hypothetical protein
MSKPAQISLEAKRQSLYACLLTHSPEFGSLRERAIDRLVLGGLLASTKENPYKVGEIQQNIHFGPDTALVRSEVIHSSLERLTNAGRIDHVLIKKKKAYFLLDSGIEELGKELDKASRLFDSVAKRMLENTEHLVSYDIGSSICRRFISECFAKFGRQIARTVCGESHGRDAISAPDIRGIIERSSELFAITPEARDSLEQRCIAFLRSREPMDEKLKFFLTQSYYFAQLIGIEGKSFNPLSEDAFASAVFYLDTNVVIPGVISLEDRTSLFHELTRIARKINIQIKVTRATINETRRVAFDKKQELDTIIKKIPTGVLDAWNDDHIMAAFLRQVEKTPQTTIDSFIEPFERLPELLSKHGIVIDERDESEFPQLNQHIDIMEIFSAEALEIRHRPKAQPVLLHDVFHYVLIDGERKTHAKTWFLSNDRSLVKAGQRLIGSNESQGSPFCFSVVGFLQSVSPFVTSTDVEGSLADCFASFLADQVMPTAQLFDIQELKLIAEMHADILSTPQDQLIQAFDFAKKSILRGRTYQTSDVPEVALGIKKFLASSSDEQRRAMREATEALEAQLRTERDKFEREERLRVQKENELAGAHHENMSLRDTVSKVTQSHDDLTAKLKAVETNNNNLNQENVQMKVKYDKLKDDHITIASNLASLQHKIYQSARFVLVIVSHALSVYYWYNSHAIVNSFCRILSMSDKDPIIQHFIKTVSILLLALCIFFQFPFFRNLRISKEFRIALLTISLGLLCWFWKIADEAYWSAWSSYVQIASVFASIAFASREPERPTSPAHEEEAAIS